MKIRKAIAHAINRQAIVDGAMFGFGTPIGTHFAPHHPDYVDLTAQSNYDPEKSKSLLSEAGVSGGLTLSLKLPPPSYARRGGEIIASQLREVGIETIIENLEWSQWLEQVFKGKDYDLTIVSHTEPMDIGIYGNPNYYSLPTSQENSFIYPYLKNSEGNSQILSGYIDSTGQFGRITTYMKDIKTSRMEEIEDDLVENISKIFPESRYGVKITGKSLLFLKGTKYLIKNLILSLSLAILLIALFMAFLFRSVKMIIISLIPNLLPLIITAGVMGFTGIPLKPSTILVFSIAFGISVDDTIHFLAKYRQELIANGWKINKAVFSALRETGISMFYTSIVLFFGFSVFLSSNFGGTQALGGLVAVTLMMAMLANLILLPSLLISLEDSISNDKVLKEPKLEILD